MASPYMKIDPLKYYGGFLEHNLRPDGRKLESFRPMSIDVNSIHTADSSAIVKIENTMVVCGIKAELAVPKPETPDEGYLVTNITLPPLCSPKYHPGPPSDEAQVATKFLEETLTNSKCTNLKDLCICNDGLVWVLHLDVICLNQDGSLIDAALAASVSALKALKLPKIEYNPETKEKTVDVKVLKQLPMYSAPISTTFAVFDNNKILADPTSEEEALCSGTVTVVAKAENGEICGVRQPGTNPLTSELLQECVSKAKKKAKLVYELIELAIVRPER